MKEHGPVRLRLGDESPEQQAAALEYVSVGRFFLGVLKNQMRAGNLMVGARTFGLPDGTVIVAQSLFGQDTLGIFPAGIPATATAEGQEAKPEEEEAEESPSNPTWIVAGYQVVSGNHIPTLWTDRGTVLPDLGGYTQGDAQKVIVVNRQFVAVIGWIDNGSYRETCWWTPQDDGTWALNLTGISGLWFLQPGMLTGGNAVTWDYDNAQPQVTSAPSVVSRTPTPHQVRVAFQRRRTFSTFDVDGPHFHVIPAMVALEVSDGTGNVYTIGRWGNDWDGHSTYPDATFGRSLPGGGFDGMSLDDWVSLALDSFDDIDDYSDVGWGAPLDDGGGPYVAADIYGPFDVDNTLLGTNYSLADGQYLEVLLDGFATLRVEGESASPSTKLQVYILAPDPALNNVSFNSVSLDGNWFGGSSYEGYYPYVRFAGNVGAMQFARNSQPVRYSASTGAEYLDLPGGMDRPSAGGPYIGINGVAALDAYDQSDSNNDVACRWTPGLTVLRGATSWVDGASPAGTAVCGAGGLGDEDQPWVFAVGAGTSNLPFPVDFAAGETDAVSDDGCACIGETWNDTDEVAVLWLRERSDSGFGGWKIALALDDTSLRFNDVATRG